MITRYLSISIKYRLVIEIILFLIPLVFLLIRETKWLRRATKDNIKERNSLSRQAYGRRFLFVGFAFIFEKMKISAITNIINLNYYVPVLFALIIIWLYGSKYKKLSVDRYGEALSGNAK